MIGLRAPKFWYQKTVFSYLLLPFSFLYLLIVRGRRAYYKAVTKRKFKVPIVVVGNLTLGGTGKTPLVIHLANLLREHGYKPGIISRGYGRKGKVQGVWVTDKSLAIDIGDEPLLIARRTQVPVVVDSNRARAVEKLVQETDCNVVLSDDGLQHYRLPRNLEIIVIDSQVKFGNGFCLPAGPLRESDSRLKQVDFIVKNFNSTFIQPVTLVHEYAMSLQVTAIHNLKNPALTKQAIDFYGETIYAVAALGRPAKFFQTLRSLGLKIIEHPFPDHYLFTLSDFPFTQGQQIIMSEKDAVKCDTIANCNFWYLEVKASLSDSFNKSFLNKLAAVNSF